ncbi:MAG: hypothetical protein HY303_06700 [Candidatus Wallbacteria bacterium]|nr:hypothetical protein [Candidatus Wallbacteria bacterium]
MDRDVAQYLEASGYDLRGLVKLPRVAIQVDERGQPMKLGAEVPIVAPTLAPVLCELKNVSALFEGDAVPPQFAKGPGKEYEPFFMTIERAAADFCKLTGRHELDREFERVYGILRKRPDGKDDNPLYSYLRAALRLYMSIHPVSRAEFEAVIDRLRKSAATFAIGAASRNYFETIETYVL